MRFLPIYLAYIFLSLSYAAILYVNSTYLGGFFSPGIVSILFLFGAALNVVLFLALPRLLSIFSIRTLFILSVLVTMSSLFALIFSSSAFNIALYSIIYFGFQFLIYYCLDIFLEDRSLDKNTGSIRGIYLTLGNTAIAAAPLLLTLIPEGGDLRPVYLASAFLLAPLLSIAFISLRSPHRRGHSPVTNKHSLPFRAWWRARNVRRVTFTRIVLEFFYALMIIYTPLYLHGTLGFEWRELGLIFPVMLLPFVLLEWPVGKLADKWWGEKELMSLGFFITGSALLVMPFLGKIFLAWMAVLFLSRVGASIIEVTTESYFFKHVDSRDTGLISIFRLSRPVSLIAGTTVGIISLSLFSFEKIFFVLAFVVFLGLKESVYLKDTL